MTHRGPRAARRTIKLEPLETRRLSAGGMSQPHVQSASLAEARSSAHAAQGTPTDLTDNGPGRIFRNIVYESDGFGAQKLDILLPAGPRPAGGWPVVVAIHGGGWRRFDKEAYEPTVEPLRDAGFAIVAPNYQLSAPGAPSWPEAPNDVRTAVRWVKEQGPAYGLSTTQVAAIGESAGGNLAAILGTDPDGGIPAAVSASVSTVIDFFGPADLASLVNESSRASPAVEQYLGGLPNAAPAAYADASPVTHVSPTSAPMLIFQGTTDPVVPEQQSIELASALDSAGVANQLVLIPGATHGFGFRVNGQSLLPRIVSFLTRNMARSTPA
jgi:acetyl esterase/lipase